MLQQDLKDILIELEQAGAEPTSVEIIDNQLAATFATTKKAEATKTHNLINTDIRKVILYRPTLKIIQLNCDKLYHWQEEYKILFLNFHNCALKTKSCYV